MVVISYGTNPTKVNSVSICSGESATLTASGVTGYNWLPDGETSESITVSPTSTTSYTIVGTNGGCSGSAVATVTVFSPVQANSVTICPGNDVVFSAEGSQSYQWSNGATTNTISLTNVTSATAYTVTGTSCGISSTAISSVVVDNCVSVTFSNSGAQTWTAPACVTSVIAEVWGGGGAGGAGTDNANSGAGGGGGGYSKSGSIPVVGETTYNLMVGSGGTSSFGAKGGNGGDSWFLNNTTILAKGGTGGGSGGNIISGIGGDLGVGGTIMFKGGDGGKDYSQGTNGAGGGGGGSAGPGGNGKNGESAASGVTNAKGGAIVSGGGAGGAGCGQGGALLPDCAGSAGLAPGGGGGGGNDDGFDGAGGAGGIGKVVITYKVVPLTISVNNAYICTGSSATLTASGATTYTWTPAADLSSANGASVSATPSTTTTYTVVGTAGGCTAEATSVVTFTACCTQASIGLTSADETDEQTLCMNDAGLPITYAVGGGGTDATVAGLPTGVTGAFSAGTFTINGTPTETGVFNYTVTTSGGCGPEEAIGSMTINDLPIINSTSPSICLNQTATLTADGAGIGGTYLWQPGSSTGVSIITSTLSSSTSYTVTGTDTEGCSNTSISNVTVTPSLSITVTGNSGVCLGGSNTLIADGADDYTWSPPDFLSTTTGATTTSTPTITATYTVVGEANGCNGTTTVTVPITPPDDATFNYSPSTVCKSGGTNPTPTTTTPGGTYVGSAGLVVDGTTGEVDIAATVIGTYTVTYTTGGACSSIGEAVISVVDVPLTDFSYGGPYCQSEANPLPNYAANASAGMFSAVPAGLSFVSTSSGEVNLSGSVPGSYTVTNSIVASGSCPASTADATIDVSLAPTTSVLDATVCDGSPATLTASGADSYVWSTGDNTQSITVSPSTSTSYTVTGTSSGCSSEAVATVTANAVPTVIVNDPSICSGETVILEASGADSYDWDEGQSTNSTYSVSPLISTSYTVTGTTGVCAATVVASVSVNASPTVITADAAVCSNMPVTITSNGADSYLWLPTNQTGNNITVSPSATTSYTVVGTTAGCTGEAVSNVTVSSNPNVTVANIEICEGETGSLVASGAATYEWDDLSTNATFSASPTGTSSYTVVGTTAGCTGQAIGTITVNNIPEVLVNSETICSGTSQVLSALGAIDYSWSNGLTGSSITVSPTASTNYTVTGTSANCSSENIAVVTVNSPPVVTVNSIAVCAGSPATLTASGAITYIWMPGGAVGTSIIVNPNVTTTYTVTGTDFAGCTGSGIGVVTANSAPDAAFSDPRKIKLSEANITFIDNSTNASSWLWDFGDTATSSIQNPQHQYADTGIYTICLKVLSDGCADSICHDLEIVPDVLIYFPNTFSPNGDGMNDAFGFKGEGFANSACEFRIFDRWGEQLFFSSNIHGLWNGDFLGVPCQQDVYIYSILFKDSDGKDKKVIGSVNLIR